MKVICPECGKVMKVICPECGKVVRAYIPSGGDGSGYRPYRHGECEGRFSIVMEEYRERYCGACGALLEETSVYCDVCGTDTPKIGVDPAYGDDRSAKVEMVKTGDVIKVVVVKYGLTEAEREMLKLLQGVTYLPGSFDKRFVHGMSEAVEMTEKQRGYLIKLFHKYRRQISHHERLCVVCEERADYYTKGKV